MLTDTFANRLQKALDLRNMKPAALSEKSGIDKSLISNYLSGNYKAKQDKLDIIAEILDVNPVWLLGYDAPIEYNHSIPKNEYDKEIEKIALELGGEIYIDKKAPLTANDVVEINKVLMEIITEQNKNKK